MAAEAMSSYFASREVLASQWGNVVVDGFRHSAWYVANNRKHSNCVLPKGNSADGAVSVPVVAPEIAAAAALGASVSQVATPGVGSLPPVRPTHFFLTHFHSDHYVGLGPRWTFGPIYCSEATARLARQSLGLDAALFRPLRFDCQYRVNLSSAGPDAVTCVDTAPSRGRPDDERCEGASVPADATHFIVTFVDANHCPGAAICIFRFPGNRVVVHTGDFRYNGASKFPVVLHNPSSHAAKRDLSFKKRPRSEDARTPNVGSLPVRGSSSAMIPLMGDNAHVAAVCGSVDTLFLDNTFCDPLFDFPPQTEVFQQVCGVVRSQLAAVRAQRSIVHAVVPHESVAPADLTSCENRTSSEMRIPETAKEEDQRQRPIRIAVLVGTYTIGKERVAMALSEEFGHAPVFASPEKMRLVDACLPAGTHPFRLLPGDSHKPQQDEGSVPAQSPTTVDDQFVAPRDVVHAHCACDDFGNRTEETFELAMFLTSIGSFHYLALAASLGLQSPRSPVGPTDSAASSAATAAAVVLREGVAATAAPPEGTHSLCGGPATGGMPEAQGRMSEGAPRDGAFIELWPGARILVNDFDAVVCIEPTGWNARSTPSRDVRRMGSRVTVFAVPYSEHSSFSELLSFVQLLRPCKIVPTVSTDAFAKQEHLFVERVARLRSRVSLVQPILNFFPRRGSLHDALSAGAGVRPTTAADAAPPAPLRFQPRAARATPIAEAKNSGLQAHHSVGGEPPEVVTIPSQDDDDGNVKDDDAVEVICID